MMTTQFSVTSMTSPLSDSQHPLFAEPGLYRQGSKLSVWTGGGKGSIVRFFYEWHREWRSFLWHQRLVDDCPTDWAYDEKTNQSIVDRLVRDRQRAEEKFNARKLLESESPSAAPLKEPEQRTWQEQGYAGALRRDVNRFVRAAAANSAGVAVDAVIVGESNDPTLSKPVEGGDDGHNCSISGLSDSTHNPDESPLTPRMSKQFDFRIYVDSDYEGRRAMMLLVRSSILERIRTVLDWPLDEEHFPQSHKPMPEYKEPEPDYRVHDPVEAADLIGRVMQILRDAPPNAEDDIHKWRRSNWIVSTLSLLPGLEGRIQDGAMSFSIPLPRELETLKTKDELEAIEFPDRFFPFVFIDQQ